ncbi:MAG: hypothetical protein A3J59_02710 [Candidatus Buchananbacteria bacterium RIFCSPHIGHO2_02_FULL_56_16]|uniref:Uncharacterized protein n=1 Tax=Candidatus Buchananbacteria bacterium RIFCSPHIGHO2_02_FULL_56_16 TaxID=1797542 RepID=A0A1G1YFW2_9BACT|nr:MAG: hypothetical protein A3J59_02710 [Candidatus Buchananbacteria bacterium RIFCSPHIGHO2_02_FULL_56_16]
MADLEPQNDMVLLAETNFRNQRVKFGIKRDDRRRHTYLIGKTGMGKSTVMENMIIQDIINGEGVALIDPHGDFAEKILNYIPSHRVNDVVYFNPADFNYPIAFNVMESVSREYKHLIASGLVGVFKKLFADSWGPRLEYVLRNSILALLDYPGSTLLGVMRILVDKNYRRKVIAKIDDPVVKSFWVDEYSKYPQQFQTEAIAPIQNKVGQFLSTALIRNILGQVKSTIDLREVMDQKKILIMNLSKGRIGEDASALLGAMMITKIQLAAMSRIDMPEETRQDFYLYVDEFQNFATESFATILSEARKYRLNLTIGHQYIEQLDEQVQAAVFGNVGTLMCFRIGAADAEALALEFAPYFTEDDLVNLTKYDIYLKLMIDGVASNPFSATTIQPLGLGNETNNKETIIKVSRERYAKPREVVEEKISRWSSVDEEEMEVKTNVVSASSRPEAPGFNRKKPEGRPKDKPAYTVNCYECGKPTVINFKPDGIRPIYCPECFQKIRERGLRAQTPATELVEEATAPAETEISLSEAVQKAPVSFKEDARRAVDQPAAPPPVKPASQPAQKNQAEDTVTTEHTLKTLKPGQVVRF